MTTDGLLRVKGWARDGLNDKQIAHNIGISRDTFYRWAREHSDFSDAIKEGKAPIDIEVENALLKSALGHTVTIRKAIKVRTKQQLKDRGTIEEEHIEYVDEEMYVPPQTVAQIYWLKNRLPSKWRDNPDESDNAEVLERLTELLAAQAEAAKKDANGGD